jgi:uncharacterized membrane protein
VAPEFLPEHLTGSWEVTWLGLRLLVVVSFFGADLFLIDRHVLDSGTGGRSLFQGLIVLGWVSTTLCKSDRI